MNNLTKNALTKTEMNKYRLLEEILKGSSITQIAKNLGKSRLTIYSWLKKYDDVAEFYRKTMKDRLNKEANQIDQNRKLMNSLSAIAQNKAAGNATTQQRLIASKHLIELQKIRRRKFY